MTAVDLRLPMGTVTWWQQWKPAIQQHTLCIDTSLRGAQKYVDMPNKVNVSHSDAELAKKHMLNMHKRSTITHYQCHY